MNKSEYLKRIAGISFELLRSKLHENKIEYRIEKEDGSKRYFRDITIKIKKDLEEMFRDYSIIPSSNDATRRFNKDEGYIELNAIYNYFIRINDVEISIDNNYVEITKTYAKRLGIESGELPKNQPIDRIKIFEED